jgi:hypothetical protein
MATVGDGFDVGSIEIALSSMGGHPAPLWCGEVRSREQWSEWKLTIELAGGDYLAIPLPRYGAGVFLVLSTVRPPRHLGIPTTESHSHTAAQAMQSLVSRWGCTDTDAILSERLAARAARCRAG